MQHEFVIHVLDFIGGQTYSLIGLLNPLQEYEVLFISLEIWMHSSVSGGISALLGQQIVHAVGILLSFFGWTFGVLEWNEIVFEIAII